MSTSKKKTTAKKAPVKKTTAKKTTSTSKKTIDGKAVGRNVILLIDGQKVSKAFKEKTDRDNILEMVTKYNTRNSLKLEKEIIEIMQKGKTTEKQRKTAVKKTTPKKTVKPKAVTAPVKEDAIAAAKALLEKDGWNVSKNAPAPAPVPKRRSGREY